MFTQHQGQVWLTQYTVSRSSFCKGKHHQVGHSRAANSQKTRLLAQNSYACMHGASLGGEEQQLTCSQRFSPTFGPMQESTAPLKSTRSGSCLSGRVAAFCLAGLLVSSLALPLLAAWLIDFGHHSQLQWDLYADRGRRSRSSGASNKLSATDVYKAVVAIHPTSLKIHLCHSRIVSAACIGEPDQLSTLLSPLRRQCPSKHFTPGR